VSLLIFSLGKELEQHHMKIVEVCPVIATGN
jgi:hypothetical protein